MLRGGGGVQEKKRLQGGLHSGLISLVFFTQNIPGESAAACKPAANTFTGNSQYASRPEWWITKQDAQKTGWMLVCKYNISYSLNQPIEGG